MKKLTNEKNYKLCTRNHYKIRTESLKKKNPQYFKHVFWFMKKHWKQSIGTHYINKWET